LQSLPVISSSEPKLVWGIICSSIFHLLLIVLLVGVPSFSSPKRTYFSSAYMVKLVDVPKSKPGRMKVSKAGKSKAGKVTAGITSKKKSKKTTKKKKVDKKKSSTLSIKDKAKKSSAIKSPKRKPKGKELEGSFSLALDKIRKKVGERRRDEEIEKIRNNIAEGESGKEVGNGEPAVGSWGIPPGEGVIANLPLNYRLYYQAIEQKIKNNWNLALPRGIIEDMRGMEVVISITIRSDGEITDISFEEKTGNVYLDDSAYRSVKKSSPLPPFSEYNIREPFFETGIVFPAGELL
jgi:colicin import membrane protein